MYVHVSLCPLANVYKYLHAYVNPQRNVKWLYDYPYICVWVCEYAYAGVYMNVCLHLFAYVYSCTIKSYPKILLVALFYCWIQFLQPQAVFAGQSLYYWQKVKFANVWQTTYVQIVCMCRLRACTDYVSGWRVCIYVCRNMFVCANLSLHVMCCKSYCCIVQVSKNRI